MCILFVALGQHKDFPLIIAANRDEFFHRPSAGLHYWEDYPNILAGRDMLAGGSWLGVNYNNRIAAVTNIRRPELLREDARSRGDLVARYLRDDDNDAAFSRFLEEESHTYNPFNLVYGTREKLMVYSSVSKQLLTLQPGYTAISNGELDDPWPKMSRGVLAVRELIEDNESLDARAFLRLMRDSTQADVCNLPDTGLGNTLELKLSSIFIESDQNYGTRTTSVLLFGQQQLDFHEVNYTPVGGREAATHIKHPYL